MLHHCRAVSRGVRAAFTVGDLPMGSYEISPEHGISSAIRLVQEGRVEANLSTVVCWAIADSLQGVKLEGGHELSPTVSRITRVGIPVLGHIGLTPQRHHSLGGFRVQGKTARSAEKLLDDALSLQEAGCFAIVLEAVPAEVAQIVTEKLEIPTIGIGAGAGCSGQVLVQMDMLGYYPEGRFMPKFLKRYGSVFADAKDAIARYKRELFKSYLVG